MRARVLFVCLVVPLILLACANARFINCEQAKIAPQAPVYPGSQLADETESIVGATIPMVTRHYRTADPPQNVVAFYQARGRCGAGEATERDVCLGDATPNGEYFVYIDLSGYGAHRVTTYTLEIRWEGCGT